MSQEGTSVFELPRKLEKILASLSMFYEQHNSPLMKQLVVNSTYYLHEGCYKYAYNCYGHNIYFKVPAFIYWQILDNLDLIATELCSEINRLSNVQRESLTNVFLELQDDPALDNWRESSGALIQFQSSPSTVVTFEDQLVKLWEPGYLRLFLTHKAEFHQQAFQFKEAMNYYGVSCFVAHKDIEPTREWQDEIEKALFSMDVLAALLTVGFPNSCWTDQEIGVAIGRQVPIIPIRFDIDPYGFIGKYQAVSGAKKNTKTLAREVYGLLWAKASLERRLAESLVTRFEAAYTFQHANDLIGYLEKIENLPPQLIDRLEKVPNDNSQVRYAFEVEKKLPRLVKRLRGL